MPLSSSSLVGDGNKVRRENEYGAFGCHRLECCDWGIRILGSVAEGEISNVG